MADIIEKKINSSGFLFSSYGPWVSQYSGTGVLYFADGLKVSCSFEVGQLGNGDIPLICGFSKSDLLPEKSLMIWSSDNTPERFEGITKEGIKLTSEGCMHYSSCLHNDMPDTNLVAWYSFSLQKLVALINDNSQPCSIRYGLTNAEVFGFEPLKIGNLQQSVLHLQLKTHEGIANKLTIIPIKDHNKIMSRIKTLRSVDVTCEVEFNISGVKSPEKLVDALCYLLSIAQGTKVQWIYEIEYDIGNRPIRQLHFERVTRPYTPLNIIDEIADAGRQLKQFLEITYPNYVQKCNNYKLDCGTVDAYLDAKIDGTYLELRGVKLAVAMEMLKTVYLELPNCPINEYCIHNDQFQALVPGIKNAIYETLGGTGISISDKESITNEKKIESLNRKSFRAILNKLCKEIKFEAGEELELFVKCRNSLIHTGCFYCSRATEKEKCKYPALASKKDEWLFLTNFVDRIFLKLLGYTGPYIDYRDAKVRWSGHPNSKI